MKWPFRRIERFLRKAWSKRFPAHPVSVSEPVRPREPGPTRIVAVTRVLDEADIIEAFVRHTAVYAGHHVILDNGSRDGTLEILRSLKMEGLSLTILQNITASFYQKELNTYLYRYAARTCRADWVLCLDADEFIDDRALEAGLTTTLERLAADGILCATVPLTNFERAADDPDEAIVPLRMRRHGPVLPVKKVFVQGRIAATTDIANGNHSATYDGVHLDEHLIPGLTLAHYSHRSPYQRVVKCVRGWSKVTAAGSAEVAKRTSYHYRGLFEIIRDRPQHFFRRARFMRPPAHDELPVDPIHYRGGPLRYSTATDEPMRAIRCMVGHLETLAERHGRLLEEIPEARARTQAWNDEIREIT